MKKIILFHISLCLSILSSFAQDLSEYVNPFIGSTNYGATNPGAIVPRGMVSVVPFNTAGEGTGKEKDSDWVSFPYDHTNTLFSGFSHVNLSGVGCPDLGAIILMPTTGELKVETEEYATTYSQEDASAGYYTNVLDRYGVKTEVSATQRAGISRFHFPAGEANIMMNLGQALSNESGGMVKMVNEQEIEGMRMVGTFCYNDPTSIYPVYFVMKVDQTAERKGIWQKHRKNNGVEGNWMAAYNGQNRILEDAYFPVLGDSLGAFFSYDFAEPTQVEVKIGVSYVSIENARENLEKEIGEKNFEQVVGNAKAQWNEVLSNVAVEGGSEDDKTVFYTSLYHSMIHPNIINDENGDYPVSKTRKTGKVENGDRYTVFSLWDTYRSLHPLLTLLYPEQQLDMVNSMLAIYDESGWLPKWELNSTETFTMVGDPASIVIADTYLKGLDKFDEQKAFEAILKNAYPIESGNPVRPGVAEYIENGYVPVDVELDEKVWGSVSTTLEYAVADWSISQYAKAIGNKEKHKEFLERAYGYRKLFDKNSKFLRPKYANGKWHEPFDPAHGANFQHNIGYVEGNAYQYNLMAQFDIPQLIKLFGGTKEIDKRLEMIFEEGHYDMANEPDIAYPYIYNYMKGYEYKTQERVLKLREEHFTNQPDGIAGNDDTGTMSAWTVFSMMGIYPDAPAVPRYALTTPAFDQITITLDQNHWKGEKITIKKEGNSNLIDAIYVNGKKQKSFFINHSDLVDGAEIIFKMKNQ
ncbi:GH92 family glycosyl hydrolase [Sediminitomix flava]|uniref:Putative alpha-1,2-mannosidase n=1 Tax=Sediminitomix flava TaxID=379075 RepID=A0A315Z9J7_SEDFL|nr:GH92 family glycosyl hydrolase [Sediminitomix flava]PWJ42181.1 putative alpha-1,2-mannosidase [Sediminitomix flava]